MSWGLCPNAATEYLGRRAKRAEIRGVFDMAKGQERPKNMNKPKLTVKEKKEKKKAKQEMKK